MKHSNGAESEIISPPERGVQLASRGTGSRDNRLLAPIRAGVRSTGIISEYCLVSHRLATMYIPIWKGIRVNSSLFTKAGCRAQPTSIRGHTRPYAKTNGSVFNSSRNNCPRKWALSARWFSNETPGLPANLTVTAYLTASRSAVAQHNAML